MTLPAMQSALYALKPTVGLLSRVGCVPFAPTFDTPGTMAKDVWSVAVGLDVMAGEDEEDPESLTVPRLPSSMRVSCSLQHQTAPLPVRKLIYQYSDFCTNASFSGLRIGLPRAVCLSLPVPSSSLSHLC